jgi:hypothetical protein
MVWLSLGKRGGAFMQAIKTYSAWAAIGATVVLLVLASLI